MKRKNIFGIAIGIIVVICILMAMVQFKKEQTAQSEVDASQKEDATALPGGITINKVEDYDTSKNYYKDYDDTGLETYVISGVFSDEKTYIEEVREANICEYIYINKYGYADVKVTEKQRKEWVRTAEEKINKILEKTADEEKCNFKFNEDYTVLMSEVQSQYTLQTYAEDMVSLIYNAEIIQIFSENKETWSVNVVIENMDTGKELVNIQYPQEDLNLEADMWDE